MSRKMNRRQMSPVKIKPNIEQRRNNLNADIHRIINHAAKLISEYDKNSIGKLLDEDLDIHTKIDKLMKESVSNLPKISMENNPKISRKRKRKKQSTGKKKKNNAENESDKIEYNFSFEDEEFDGNKQPSNSEKHRNSLQSNNSVFSNETDQKMEDLSKHNDDMELKSENQTIPSDLSIEKSTSCSICSQKHFSKKNSYCQPQNEREVRYIYEIEIKTANETFFGEDVSVSIQLYGLSKNMVQSIKLFENNSSGNHAKLFTPGNVDKFSIILDEYLGSIESVKIGIESENEDTLWNLDYLCVRDCSVKSDYFFSCRRCLGINSSDRLTHVTLVYTPPFKLDKHDSLSKSNTENLEEEKFVESFKSRRTISKSNNSSRSQSLLSQKSDQIQQLEIDHDFSAKHKESKSSDKKNSSDKRSRKTSSTISNDEKSSFSSQRSLSSPESARSQINKGVYSMENSHHNIDIHSAVRSHNVLRVRQLCKNEENKKDKIDENGCKPIHLASVYFQDIEECKEILQYFISLGIDINTKSTNDFTCLHYAVFKNNLLAVKYLIEYCGANPNVTDKNGDTSLQIANNCNFPDIAKYLASIKNNSKSKENISMNEEEPKFSIPNPHPTNKNQTFTDLDKRNQDKNRDDTIEDKFEPISISNDRNILSYRRVSSDSIKSVNSQIIPLMQSLSNLRDRSSEERASAKSSDSNRSTSISSDDSDLTVKSNSTLLRSTDNKEITTTIDIAHKPNSPLMNNNSSKFHDSREGIISVNEPILIDNLSLTPIPASADNNSVKISEDLQSVESKRKEINKTISNKDSSESRQLVEENYGLMFHKSLPDREDRKFQNKFKEKESSNISLSSSESKVNIDNTIISPITSRPNSVDSLSNINQTTRNNEEEDLNKNSLVAENLLKKNDDNDDDNSVKISENFHAVESERKKSNKIISDKDSLDNLESRQLEAESQGLMLQKSLPIRKELKDEELSSISSNIDESKVSSRMSNISPITPRSNSSISISDNIETNRNKGVENSNKNPLVTENVQTTTENLENKNENLVQHTSTEENNNNHNNIPKAEPLSNDTQKDHSISKGQSQSTFDSN